ncbi:MAG: aspartate kinase [Synergistaceae bacterium]|jgi:aspartate kinase|nr:aspartate kinase [Synergistaceae bacterium]
MTRKVMKFGGSSLANAARIRSAAKIVAEEAGKGTSLAVVVSAMGKTTEGLLGLAEEVSCTTDRRELDQLLASGEQQSAALFSLALKDLGVPARSYTGAQAGIRASGMWMDGRICEIVPTAILQGFERGECAIVAGFQGLGENGEILTLGRGGSDLTAVALAAALDAQDCLIYTDVDGIYSADPNRVGNARRIDCLSYEECLEMAVLGAKVMQARSVEMAAKYGVPITVLSSFQPGGGTKVQEKCVGEDLVVRAVVPDRGVAKVAVLGVPDVPGIAAKLFSGLAGRGIHVEMIIQSTMRGQVNDIAFLVKKGLLGEAIDACRNVAREIGAQGVNFDVEVGRVSIVGAGIANHVDVPGRMFTVLAREGINLDMIASTSGSITCVVALDRLDDAARALHREFIEEEQA